MQGWRLCYRDKKMHCRDNIHVWEKDFQILGNNYQSNFLSESLGIRQLQPTLNINGKPIWAINGLLASISYLKVCQCWFYACNEYSAVNWWC